VKLGVVIRPEANEDLRNLTSTSAQWEAAKYILRLERQPYLGQRLEHLAQTGDMSDCRKIYIDERRYRIVYRLLPDEKEPAQVDVIAVGRRERLEVYIEAARRLGRLPEGAI
jgi:addiction module RelE/StbE family toxin